MGVCVSLTGKHRQPLQAYLHHMEGFLSLIEGDRLSTLLLNVQLQMVLKVTANSWEITAKEKEGTHRQRRQYKTDAHQRDKMHYFNLLSDLRYFKDSETDRQILYLAGAGPQGCLMQ